MPMANRSRIIMYEGKADQVSGPIVAPLRVRVYNGFRF